MRRSFPTLAALLMAAVLSVAGAARAEPVAAGEWLMSGDAVYVDGTIFLLTQDSPGRSGRVRHRSGICAREYTIGFDVDLGDVVTAQGGSGIALSLTDSDGRTLYQAHADSFFNSNEDPRYELGDNHVSIESLGAPYDVFGNPPAEGNSTFGPISAGRMPFRMEGSGWLRGEFHVKDSLLSVTLTDGTSGLVLHGPVAHLPTGTVFPGFEAKTGTGRNLQRVQSIDIELIDRTGCADYIPPLTRIETMDRITAECGSTNACPDKAQHLACVDQLLSSLVEAERITSDTSEFAMLQTEFGLTFCEGYQQCLVVTNPVIVRQDGYQSGYTDGFTAGATSVDVTAIQSAADLAGFQRGDAAGYARGVIDGTATGDASGYARGVLDGTATGDAAGYARGLTDGDLTGYSRGRVDGLNEGIEQGYRNGHADGYTLGRNSGLSEGYQTGFQAGSTDGYGRGRDAGYASGYSEGDNAGFVRGLSTGDAQGFGRGDAEGFIRGDAEGYTRGRAEGYTEGFTAGETAGYAEGVNDGDRAGYARGYSAGNDAGSASGFTAGFTAGDQNGFNRGYASGTSAGYGAGFAAGDAEGFERGDAAGYSRGFDAGHDAGFAEGAAQGFTDGNAAGYSRGMTDGTAQGYQTGYGDGDAAGYTRGISDGKTQGYQTGYAAGDTAGYARGLDAGRTSGYNQGYSDGFSEGYTAGKADDDGKVCSLDDLMDDARDEIERRCPCKKQLTQLHSLACSVGVLNDLYKKRKVSEDMRNVLLLESIGRQCPRRW